MTGMPLSLICAADHPLRRSSGQRGAVPGPSAYTVVPRQVRFDSQSPQDKSMYGGTWELMGAQTAVSKLSKSAAWPSV
eukprot:5173062-Pyramimonas_sp.AAC.2